MSVEETTIQVQDNDYHSIHSPQAQFTKYRPMRLKEAVELAMNQRRLEERKEESTEKPSLSKSRTFRKLAVHWCPAHDEPTVGFQLNEIDQYFQRTKPPAIEYLIVEVIVTRNPCNLSHFGRWAHSAIRYTLPTGEQKLVNICRPEQGHELIEYYDDPRDYILGVDGKGGIFSRDIASIRIEEMNESSIWAIHHYFQSTTHRYRADGKGVKFKLTGGFWHNMFRYLFHLRSRPSGNCAKWVSKGLVYANALKRPSMFPKAIFKELIEDQTALNPDNVHVVYYKRVKAKAKLKRFLKTGFCFLNVRALFFFPVDFINNLIYWDMQKFADVIVENSDEATLEQQSSQLQCQLVKGPGYRLPSGVIFGFRILHVCILIAAISFYTLYCPGGYDDVGEFGVCESGTYPRTMGFRALAAFILLGIFEFWFY